MKCRALFRGIGGPIGSVGYFGCSDQKMDKNRSVSLSGACDANKWLQHLYKDTSLFDKYVIYVQYFSMFTGAIHDIDDKGYDRLEAMEKKGIEYSGLRLQRPRYPQSAPATRYPLGMARNSLNENLSMLSVTRYSINKSCSNILQLDLVNTKHAQFDRNCENFGKFVNEFKKRNETESLNNCNNPDREQAHSAGNRGEGILSLTIFGNSSVSHRVRSLPSSSHLGRDARNVNNENLGKKGIGGARSPSPMRMGRSLGRLTSSREFASSFSSNSKPQGSIKLHNSEPSSFFEIESEVTSELEEESPILYSDIQATITSPHHPPFALPIESNQRKILRPNNLFSHNNASLTRADYFQDYMEEIMARWRPGHSQFNVDDTMDGKHPYQQETFELEAKAYNPFITLKAWFNRKAAIPDLENQNQTINHSKTDKERNKPMRDTLVPQLPEISERLKKIEFKINSSNSIIPKPFKPGECSHVTKVLRQSSTQQELTPIDGPSYTPKALPFNDYDLNFETKDCFSSHKPEKGSNAIIDSMDEDIRDLLNGFDNFLSDCFQSFLNACSSTGKMCFNPT